MKSDAVKGLIKSLGEGVVSTAADARDITVKLPTGIFPFDYALGGGWPIGRIMHIFGRKSASKTTTILRSFANAQRACANCWRIFKEIPPVGAKASYCPCKDYREPVCGYMDAEGTLDLEWAKTLGVDLDRLILSRPPVAEEGIDVADVWLRSGEMDLIAIDSIAFLVPLKEQEKESGSLQPGEHARLVNKLVRKMVSGSLSIQRTTGRYPTVFLLNQIREKIGVMFGCFHYDARVMLADGGSEKIGKIVNQRLPVEVMSFDPATGQCVPAKVTGWHDNGNAEFFLQFVVESVGGSGCATFGVTPNHHIFVPEEGRWVEREAGSLKAGDVVGHRALVQFNALQRQVAVASVLGDGSLRKMEGRHYTQLRFGHGAEQIDYARWKAALMDGCTAWEGPVGEGGWGFDCRPSLDMTSIHAEAYTATGRKLSETVLRELTPFSVAIWYMDVGTFSGSYLGYGKAEIAAKIYTIEELERLAARLEELGCGRPTVTSNGLLWSGEQTALLHQQIAQYVPPCMEHKLHPRERGKYVVPEMPSQADRYVLVPVEIKEIYQKPPTHSMKRFDLTVEGHHTYLVDGVAVHNSPETTTGGNAPGFAATVEVKFSPKKVENDPESGVALWADIGFKIEKNKVAGTAKMDGEYKLILADSTSKKKGQVYDEPFVISKAQEHGLITGAGSSWHCLGEHFSAKSLIEKRMVTDPAFGDKLREETMRVLLFALTGAAST
jgi:recombination protein RecA